MSAMVWLYIPATLGASVDIDLPAHITHRSTVGSILITPGTSIQLTEQEWSFIILEHPSVAKQIKQLR